MTFKDLFTTRVWTLSNALSIYRVVVLPFLWSYIERSQTDPSYTSTAIMIGITMILSDFFDGFLARKLGQETPLGQYLDPTADKICIITVLISLHLYKGLPLWLLIFIIVREIIGTWAGIYLLVKRNVLGKPNYWGKWGVTTVSFTAIIYLLDLWWKHWTLGPVVFTFTGGVIAYVITYWDTMKSSRDQT